MGGLFDIKKQLALFVYVITNIEMNRLDIINRIKYSQCIYNVYHRLGNFIISCLKLFLKPNEKLIVFASFGGRKFDDSPRVIYDAMIYDNRFYDYEFVWAFIYPDNFIVEKGKKIQIDSFQYFKTLLKARVWITNSSMTRGLKFNGIHTLIINTWHGSAIKKMGKDLNKDNKSFKLKSNKYIPYIMLAQGKYDVNVFHKAFNHPIEDFRITGLPRNDELSKSSIEKRLLLKSKLNLPIDKKVILYAPTFREYNKDRNGNCQYTLPINIAKWQEALGNDYVILFRAHYEVARAINCKDNDFLRDVSSYPVLNDLILVSDLLISDYSSIFIDYSITGKPMFCFAYDYDEYQEKRGLYFDIRKELEMNGEGDSEDKLIHVLQNYNVEKRCVITRIFRDKYVEKYGDATLNTLNLIYEELSCKK